MKNFPHQVNELEKLRGALETIRDLRSTGRDVEDDGVLGYELANRLIYTFRQLNYDDPNLPHLLGARIADEQTKPAESQGARTAARDLRRTVRYLGWTDASHDITSLGEEVLEAALGSPEERVLLAGSLSNLVVADSDGNRSHPVRVLLRLVDSVEFRSREGMELALEALDDSEQEFQRVLSVAALPLDRLEAERSLLSISPSQAKNAVKILPTLALRADLMAIDPSGRYVLTSAGRALISGGAVDLGTSTSEAQPPGVSAGQPIRTTPENVARRRLGGRRPLSEQEQLEASELLAERTDRHQALVRAAAAHAGRAAIFEEPFSFDLLFDPEEGGSPDA